jgi:hypothetical protein
MDETTTTTHRRRRTLLLAGVGAVVVIGLVAAAFALGNGGKDEPAAAAPAPSAPEDRVRAATITTDRSTRSNDAKSRRPKGTSRGGTGTTTPPPGSASGGNGPAPTSAPSAPAGRTPAPISYDTTPPAVVDAYTQAYLAECASIWSIAGSDGLLIDVEDPLERSFVREDCDSLLDPDEADWYETVEDARAAGREDAVWNFDEIMEGRRLRNTKGDKVWTSPLSPQ